MSHQLTLFYKPSCSKSQKAQTILDDLGYSYTRINYIEEGLNSKTLNQLLSTLDIPARRLIREKDFSALNLDIDLSNDNDIVSLLTQKPELLQRPILLFKDERGIIARPPETIIKFLKP